MVKLTGEQISRLYEIGKFIANYWIEETGKLNPNYRFTTDGDHEFVLENVKMLGLDIDNADIEKEVWMWVRDGYQYISKRNRYLWIIG